MAHKAANDHVVDIKLYGQGDSGYRRLSTGARSTTLRASVTAGVAALVESYVMRAINGVPSPHRGTGRSDATP